MISAHLGPQGHSWAAPFRAGVPNPNPYSHQLPKVPNTLTVLDGPRSVKHVYARLKLNV